MVKFSEFFAIGESLTDKDLARSSELWRELGKAEDEIGVEHRELIRESSTCIAALIDEVRRGRAQLAEARRDAVPWRDGPAKGGKIVDLRPAEFVTIRFINDGHPQFWAGKFIRLDAGYLTLKIGDFNYGFGLRDITHFKTQADLSAGLNLLPAGPAEKAGVA